MVAAFMSEVPPRAWERLRRIDSKSSNLCASANWLARGRELGDIGLHCRPLSAWAYVLGDSGFRRPYGSSTDLMESVVRAVLDFLSRIVLAILRFERSLLYGLQQRAEYFADRLAAEAGSTEAALGLTDKLHLGMPCMRRVASQVVRGEHDPWAVVAAFISEVPPKEWERLRRIDAQAGQAIDSTHPATGLRHALLERQAACAASVTTSRVEQETIQAELAPAFERAGATLLEEVGSRAQ